MSRLRPRAKRLSPLLAHALAVWSALCTGVPLNVLE